MVNGIGEPRGAMLQKEERQSPTYSGLRQSLCALRASVVNG